MYKTLDYGLLLRDMSNIDFWGKGLRIVSSPHFVYDFSRKMFLTLDSIN